MKKYGIIVMFLVVIILIIGLLNINAMGKVNTSNLELVMSEGETIKATTKIGEITVIAGKGLERTYAWDKCKGSVTLWPRKERWNGGLGEYYPGPGNHWADCNGISRCVVEEGIQHFDSDKKLLEWIKNYNWIELVYTNDGLLVCWQKSPQRKQLNVEVWQLMVDGKKPKKITGASNSKIHRIYK